MGLFSFVTFFLYPCFVLAADWMDQRIHEDLAYWKRVGVSRSALREALHKGDTEWLLLMRVVIQDGKVSFFRDARVGAQGLGRDKELEQSLSQLLCKRKLPDTEFLLTVHDYVPDFYKYDVPLFTFAKREGDNRAICMPDHEALLLYEGLKKSIVEASERLPWSDKKMMGFWRGQTTGPEVYRLDNCLDMPRSKLVMMSRQNPDLLDARFSFFNVYAELTPLDATLAKLEQHCPLGDSVCPGDSLTYCYQINVDGNTCSYSRMFWTLLSNSLLLKQETDHIQWYYGLLERWKHYVPLKEDCSDVIDKILWAHGHDDECQQIAKNATELVPKIFEEDRLVDYLEKLIVAYTQECLID